VLVAKIDSFNISTSYVKHDYLPVIYLDRYWYGLLCNNYITSTYFTTCTYIFFAALKAVAALAVP